MKKNKSKKNKFFSFVFSCFGCVILAIGGISDENTVL